LPVPGQQFGQPVVWQGGDPGEDVGEPGLGIDIVEFGGCDQCGDSRCPVRHGANIEDRDGAPDLLKAIRFSCPWLRYIFADGGYAGDKLKDAMRGHGRWTIDIVKPSDAAKGFVVLPRRWVVERTFAWLNQCRRLAGDWEKSIASSTAFAHIASIRMLTRRIARYSNCA
jgi:putative transposase